MLVNNIYETCVINNKIKKDGLFLFVEKILICATFSTKNKKKIVVLSSFIHRDVFPLHPSNLSAFVAQTLPREDTALVASLHPEMQ